MFPVGLEGEKTEAISGFMWIHVDIRSRTSTKTKNRGKRAYRKNKSTSFCLNSKFGIKNKEEANRGENEK